MKWKLLITYFSLLIIGILMYINEYILGFAIKFLLINEIEHIIFFSFWVISWFYLWGWNIFNIPKKRVLIMSASFGALLSIAVEFNILSQWEKIFKHYSYYNHLFFDLTGITIAAILIYYFYLKKENCNPQENICKIV